MSAAHTRAFTLVEAIATIVVLAILATGASTIVLDAADAYADATTVAELHTEGSVALDRIVRELRSIEPDPDSPGSARIGALAPASIRFNASDRIWLDGTTLRLSKDGADGAILLHDVSAFELRAFDHDNEPLGRTLDADAADDAQRIAVSLTLSRHGHAETLRTRVFLRATMADAGGSP